MQQDSPLAFDLPAVARKKVSIAFDGGMLSSDAGVGKGPGKVEGAFAELPRYFADADHACPRRGEFSHPA